MFITRLSCLELPFLVVGLVLSGPKHTKERVRRHEDCNSRQSASNTGESETPVDNTVGEIDHKGEGGDKQDHFKKALGKLCNIETSYVQPRRACDESPFGRIYIYRNCGLMGTGQGRTTEPGLNSDTVRSPFLQ